MANDEIKLDHLYGGRGNEEFQKQGCSLTIKQVGNEYSLSIRTLDNEGNVNPASYVWVSRLQLLLALEKLADKAAA